MRKRSERAEESAQDISRDTANPACREGIPSNGLATASAQQPEKMGESTQPYPYSPDEGGEAMSYDMLSQADT
jgi:hypothetical protein